MHRRLPACLPAYACYDALDAPASMVLADKTIGTKRRSRSHGIESVGVQRPRGKEEKRGGMRVNGAFGETRVFAEGIICTGTWLMPRFFQSLARAFIPLRFAILFSRSASYYSWRV